MHCKLNKPKDTHKSKYVLAITYSRAPANIAP